MIVGVSMTRALPLALLTILFSATAEACPECRAAVREQIFAGNFAMTLLQVMSPFAALALVGLTSVLVARWRDRRP